jgi:large subunit ribosomal protein L30
MQANKAMSYLKITWKKSYIGRNQKQRRIIRSLGLRRLNHSVVHRSSPSIRGMVQKTIHMLHVEELENLPVEPSPTETEDQS